MFKDIFAKLLKEKRTNALRVAKEISVPKSVVYEWKSGEREPSVENMLKLSEYFSVSLEYLTGREGEELGAEKELIVMLRAARAISQEDHDKLISSFKKDLDDYLSSKADGNDKDKN